MTYMTSPDSEGRHAPKVLSVAATKARFADCLRTVERGQPIVITRHGKRIAALVPASELTHLQRLRAAGPETGLTGLAGGWKGSEELADSVSKTRRTKSRRGPRLA